MSEMKPGRKWPGMRTEPREFGRCAAAPAPDEVELETAYCDSNEQGGVLQ